MNRTIDTPSDKDKDVRDRNNTWRYLCQSKNYHQVNHNNSQ